RRRLDVRRHPQLALPSVIAQMVLILSIEALQCSTECHLGRIARMRAAEQGVARCDFQECRTARPALLARCQSELQHERCRELLAARKRESTCLRLMPEVADERARMRGLEVGEQGEAPSEKRQLSLGGVLWILHEPEHHYRPRQSTREVETRVQ